MYLFLSLIAIGLLITPINIYLFSSKRFRVTRHYLDKVFRKYIKYFSIPLIVVVLDRLELIFGERIGNYFNWDYTPLIHSIEGNLVLKLQNYQNIYLTYFMAFMYIFMFTYLLYFSLIYYAIFDEEKNVKKISFAYLINYLLLLPFYLFFPVYEVWYSYHVLGINNTIYGLVGSFDPVMVETLTKLSGINNCFPSGHTSLSVTVSLIAIKSNHKRLAIFSTASALLIIFSTMYLAIHWVLDVFFGIALGLIVVFLVERIS